MSNKIFLINLYFVMCMCIAIVMCIICFTNLYNLFIPSRGNDWHLRTTSLLSLMASSPTCPCACYQNLTPFPFLSCPTDLPPANYSIGFSSYALLANKFIPCFSASVLSTYTYIPTRHRGPCKLDFVYELA